HAEHSSRMKQRNPSRLPAVAAARAQSISVTYRDALLPPEAFVRAMLGGQATPQHPIGKYVVDFAFPAARVVLELDGKTHERRSRHAADLVRDRWLVREGWKVLRVCYRHLAKPSHWLAVLKELVPGLQVPGGFPPLAHKYGVLLRDQQYPAGRKLYSKQGRRVTPLRHDDVDWPPPSTV